MTTSTCTRCQKEKPTTEFSYCKRYGVQKWCKECQTEYRINNRDKRNEWVRNRKDLIGADLYFRQSNLKKKYGISLENYDSMFESQGGRCKICGLPETDTKRTNGTGSRRLHVDHCHSSGRVRGLLCTCCNNVLGRAHDSIEILESAIKYLKDTDHE